MRYIILLGFSLLFFLTASCYIGEPGSDRASDAALVTLYFGSPGTGIHAATLTRAVTKAVPSDAASVKLTVTAPDMDTIEQTVEVSTSDTVTVKVKKGTARTFKIEAFDSAGTLLYTGSHTQDLADDTVTIAITAAYVGPPVYRYFAYLSSWSGNTITVAEINTATGALTPGTPMTHSNEPHCVGVDPSGQYAYIGYGLQAVTTITNATVDKDTGSLTMGTTTATGPKPVFVAVHPNGKWAYVASYNDPPGLGDVRVHPITNGILQVSTQTFTASGTLESPHAIAIHPNGNYLYIADYNNDDTVTNNSQIRVCSINQTDGSLTLVQNWISGTHSNPNDEVPTVAVHPNGKFLYGTYIDPGLSATCFHIFTIDQSNFQITSETEPFNAALPITYESVAVEPLGKFLYLVYSTTGSEKVEIYSIDQTTGAVTYVSPLSPGSAFHTVNIGRTTVKAPATQ
ncbi:MAG: beta-propeller fold lactonase family protein [Spirochaetota bacterium]